MALQVMDVFRILWGVILSIICSFEAIIRYVKAIFFLVSNFNLNCLPTFLTSWSLCPLSKKHQYNCQIANIHFSLSKMYPMVWMLAQCNLDLVTLNLVTTCDIVTI
jgi:hypothetical protein